jgi:hypothetical protein
MGLLDSITTTVSSSLPSLTSLTNKSKTNLSKYSTPSNATTKPIGNYQYPAGLTVNPDMQHWVTFYINVRGASKIAQDRNLAANQSPVPMNGENRVDPSKMSQGTTAAGALTGAVASLGIGKTIGKAIANGVVNGGGSLIKGAAAGVAAGAAVLATGATAGAIASNLAVKSDTTYRIAECITLHVSQAPSVHYGADYDIVNLGAVQGFFDGGSSLSDTVSGSGKWTEAMRAAARAAMAMPANLITSGTASQEVASKQSLNPYREVLFKSVGFRRFQFDYQFLPQSQVETDQVQKIIELFKYHMHPEMSNGGLYYIHPSEFNIQYYYKGKENNYFNKISTCVLTDMHVDYGDRNDFSSFTNGAPTEITMSLTFQELETLTKERIIQGY